MTTNDETPPKVLGEEKTCEICGSKEDVTTGPDPFDAEINGDMTDVDLCDRCHGLRLEDI